MRVAVVTVGDELLAGDTVNTNAAWLGEQVSSRGATVERVTVVPDRVTDVASIVDSYRRSYDAVVVTGGLGPTHDDVTMAGIAAAFDRELEVSEAAARWLEETGGYARDELADGTVLLPAGASPLHNEVGVAPGCVLESVYVLPGVPEEMRAMFAKIAAAFDGQLTHVRELHSDEPESALVDRLRTVQDRFDVKVGSYPGDGVRIKLEHAEEAVVTEAAAWLNERLDGGE